MEHRKKTNTGENVPWNDEGIMTVGG